MGVEAAGGGEGGSSDEYEVETMTAAEVLEKLEEVGASYEEIDSVLFLAAVLKDK